MSHQLSVGRLPSDITVDELRTVFGTYGKVEDAQLIGGGKAIINYASRDAAEDAIEVLHELYKIRADADAPITVDWDDWSRLQEDGNEVDNDGSKSFSRDNGYKVFVGGLPENIKEEELKSVFQTYGNVTSIRMLKVQATTGLRAAFVFYEDKDSAVDAIKVLDNQYKIRHNAESPIMVKWGVDKQLLEPERPSVTGYKLFVGSLPGDITEEELRKVFTTYGEVNLVKVIGAHKDSGDNAALVFFDKKENAEEAIELLHEQYKIRADAENPIRVKWGKEDGKGDKGKGKWDDEGKGRWDDTVKGKWDDKGKGKGKWDDKGKGKWDDKGKGKWDDKGKGNWDDKGKGKWDDRGKGDRGGGGQSWSDGHSSSSSSWQDHNWAAKSNESSWSTSSQGWKDDGWSWGGANGRDRGWDDDKGKSWKDDSWSWKESNTKGKGRSWNDDVSKSWNDESWSWREDNSKGKGRSWSDDAGSWKGKGDKGNGRGGGWHDDGGDAGHTSKLYVSNLPEDISEYALEYVFNNYGKVQKVSLNNQKSVKGAITAFVEYDNLEDAETAISSLHNTYEIREGFGPIWVKHALRSKPY